MQNRAFAEIVGENLGTRKKFLTPAAKHFTLDPTDRIGYIKDVQKIVKGIAAQSFDDLVRIKDLHVLHEGLHNIKLDTGNNQTLFTSLSLQQLCTTMDIPSSYIRRCLEAGEAQLAAENLNHWLYKQDDARELFLRMTKETNDEAGLSNDRLHGVLSNKYVTFDDTEVVRLTEDELSEQGGYKIHGFSINPDQMRMRLISDKTIDLSPKDDMNGRGGGLHLGLDISNSRVGVSSFSVKIILYRSACDNGMIFGWNDAHYFKRRHSGTLSGEIRSSFRKVLGELPDFMTHCQGQITKNMTKEITAKDLDDLLNEFRVEAVNSVATAAEIRGAMGQYEMTSWGFINAITQVAQQYQLEQRDRMESFAGALLMK